MAWELPSNSGRETARWTVVAVEGKGAQQVFCCDIELLGKYYGEALDGSGSNRLHDFDLTICGLKLGLAPIELVVETIENWLELPLKAQRETKLELSCGMGGLFDQSLTLALGRRSDTISGGLPVATLQATIGRMVSEFSYVVDPSCLTIFVDGIKASFFHARS